MAEVDAAFVSIGCNRGTKCVSWGPCDLVAFASHSSVGIFSPKSASILLTLPGHKDLVTCLEWFPQNADASEHFLLSGSADGMVLLWAYDRTEKKWRTAGQVKSHGNSVTCISCIMLSPTEALFVSAAYLEARIWSVSLKNIPEIILVDTIATVGSVLAASVARLPYSSEHLVLALGGFDQRLRLYTGTKTEQFTPACELKGHLNWIQCVHFSRTVRENGEGCLFVASSSQDKMIRIWKLVPKRTKRTESSKSDLWTYMEAPEFNAGGALWQVLFESLLVGHEDWVYSVCWQPCKNQQQSLAILSAGMDKTMMIWRPDAKSGLWINDVTVGELEHSAIGFFGGVWSPEGDAILAHGYHGTFHLWKHEDGRWIPLLVPSGHFSSVVDVAWAKNGQFLLSASEDQTTRVFADCNKDPDSLLSGWHEIARPQVHGHAINCVAVVQGKGNHRYVSGADEKVARVFGAPTTFVDTVCQLTTASEDDFDREVGQVFGANMSALGLSQKPIYTPGEVDDTADASYDSMDYIPSAAPAVLTRPPLEEQLSGSTLWPETHKLYGHGNELYSICSNHSGTILATACKAQSPNVAEIWLWETKSWRPLGQLRSHKLTVTQLEFSYDDRFLLSVSRDRHFSLFQRGPESYNRVAYVEAHTRIVWTCSWSPCNSKFATGSRDKIVKIWSLVEDSGTAEVKAKVQATLPTFQSSVSALAWGREVLAVGMESGMIELWSTLGTMSCLKKLDEQLCHVANVSRLRWKNVTDDSDQVQQLASCGGDCAVRLFNVKVRC